ncbi:MAG: hypothetical protein COA79_24085 [Planctomycetota bacterium]|nr:MAG: hypothetical protein COA79_24085 [Planctomycetota bacterium]
MGFFSRLFNIGRSHVNATLDKMEDPSKLIDIQIQDARKSVAEYQKQVASIMADHRIMVKKLQDAEKEKNQWLKAAERWAKDDQAKALECVNKAEVLENEVQEYKKLVKEQARIEEEMKTNLEAVQQKMKEAESARVQVKAAAKRAEAKERTAKILSNKSFDNSAFSALEKLKTKSIEQEARADAQLELNSVQGIELKNDANLLSGPEDGLSVEERIKALSGGGDNSNSLEYRIAALSAPKQNASESEGSDDKEEKKEEKKEE